MNATFARSNFFGGVTKYLIPDNLKSAVIDAEQFDPILNPTYKRFAAHYRTIVKPARQFKPKDKANVEKGVQVTENKAPAPLRNRTFFTLAALNKELEILRDEANNAPFQKLTGTRATWFEAIDRPALKPLPAQVFEFEEWITGYRVPADYYVNVKGHLYSVPYTYAHNLLILDSPKRSSKSFTAIPGLAAILETGLSVKSLPLMSTWHLLMRSTRADARVFFERM